MKRTIIATAALLLPLLISACNTMEGAGQDIKAGGSKLERSADDHKNY